MCGKPHAFYFFEYITYTNKYKLYKIKKNDYKKLSYIHDQQLTKYNHTYKI